MGDEKEKGYCSEHGVCQVKIDSNEKRLSELESDWESKFQGYKDYFNKELDKIKNDITLNVNAITDMKIAMVELKNSINNMTVKIESFLTEYENNAKDRKNNLFYPIIVAVAGGIIGVVIGKFMK